jgi:hypothetical protein
VMRGQDAPPRRYTPYNDHDQRGYRGNERPQGYRIYRGDRGYETPNFRAQRHSFSSSNQLLAGQRDREEDHPYVGRQIPAQEAQNGGFGHHYSREPPRGRGHFPAAQPRHPHPYARDAGDFEQANAANHQARREHLPNLDEGNHQARRQHRPNLDDGNHQARREHRPNGPNARQNPNGIHAGPDRRRLYYGDVHSSQSPSPSPIP